jgi:predicted RNA-binding protein
MTFANKNEKKINPFNNFFSKASSIYEMSFNKYMSITYHIWFKKLIIIWHFIKREKHMKKILAKKLIPESRKKASFVLLQS